MYRTLLLIFLFAIPLVTQAAQSPDPLGFADSLAKEGDHYRAITEYKRFIYDHPDSPLLPRVRLAIATSLVAGQRWEEADASLESFFLRHPQSSESLESRRLYADSAYQRGAYGLARERYRSLLRQPLDAGGVDYANFKIGWTFLEQDRPQLARNSFIQLPPEYRQPLLSELENYSLLPRKSPSLAGTLSALLPGAGQLYTGRPRQAALAFLLNGAFIYAALEALDNDNNAVAGILFFFEAGWYGGNIYNAANNAHKFNHRIRQQFREELRSRPNLQLGLVQQSPAVALVWRF